MGIDTSRVEVTQIDKQGIWVLIGEKESFLSLRKLSLVQECLYKDYPQCGAFEQ
jgi:hypothetical protein